MTSKYPPHGRGSVPLKCRECGRSRDEVEHMSARGLCDVCAPARNAACQTQLAAGAGPHYEQWVAGILDHARSLLAR